VSTPPTALFHSGSAPGHLALPPSAAAPAGLLPLDAVQPTFQPALPAALALGAGEVVAQLLVAGFVVVAHVVVSEVVVAVVVVPAELVSGEGGAAEGVGVHHQLAGGVVAEDAGVAQGGEVFAGSHGVGSSLGSGQGFREREGWKR